MKRSCYLDFGGPIRRGSDYKYWRLMHALYGTEPLSGNRSDLPQGIKRLKAGEFDVVALPGDRHTLWRVAAGLGLPYILSEHDIYTWRRGEDSTDEQEMIENAAAVVFTSQYHLDYCAARYRMPPATVIPLRPMEDELAFEPLPKLPGKTLVYAGGIVAWSYNESIYGYRAYHHIFRAFMDAGWEVHIYHPYGDLKNKYREYEKMGCICHEPISQSGGQFYRELSQYTAGLHGYNTDSPPACALDYAFHCMPNKCWEYLAAGIPTIGVNSGKSGAVFDGKWGVVKPEGADLRDWLEGLELPEITDEMRYAQTMDQDAPKLAQLLDPVML